MEASVLANIDSAVAIDPAFHRRVSSVCGHAFVGLGMSAVQMCGLELCVFRSGCGDP